MKYLKFPITVSNQIIKLKERGLFFENEMRAHNYLSNISYYRLRAYTFPFQDNTNERQLFNVNISFEQIIKLYMFDRKLRLLIFDAIEKIEVALRTQIIYHFALTHGSHWQLKPDLYRDPMRFANHLDSLQKEIDRSTETFISHYKNKYTQPSEPPCWMSLEVSSMGLLSKIFQNLKKGPEKEAVTKHFGLTDLSVIENWILCFSTLRNICAHHGRIWNRRLIPIKMPTHPTNVFLKNKKVYTNKLYATLSCVEYVLKIISSENNFSTQLIALMHTCPLAQSKEMGFPANWYTEDLWKDDRPIS
jgi:abortive infection bacteriophage resistance protein